MIETNSLKISGLAVSYPDSLEKILDETYHKQAGVTASTITVTIKDDEKTLNAKYLVYQDYSINVNDPVISMCIAQTLKSFEGEPNEVRVRINLSL